MANIFDIPVPQFPPQQSAGYIAPSTFQILNADMSQDFKSMLSTAPPGGYTVSDQLNQLGAWLSSHSTTVYFGFAALLALLLIGGGSKRR